MKNLFLIETLGIGGAERVLVNTLPELQKLGIACEVAILFDRDDLAEELEARGIKVHRLSLSYKWNVIEGVFKLNQLLSKNHYDIIHAHLFFAYFYTGLIKPFHPKIKSVTTFHNLGYSVYPATSVWKKLRKKLDAFVVNRLIDKTVAVSRAVAEHYSHHLDIVHVDLIFNSFPLSTINSLTGVPRLEILKRYVDIKSVDCFSITPGRLVKEKGHSYLIEAMQEVKIKSPSLCHFIVGAGPLEKQIATSIREKKIKNVLLIPGLSQEELFVLIQACDFVVVPSISEGFPMVVGESMALGKPIIATNISGVVDMIDDENNGLLVSPKNSQALAQAIERLYSDTELRMKLAKNAQEKIKQFDAKIIARQWKTYYEKMLG